MTRGLFITGTDTGVGKTVIAAAIAMAVKTRDIDIGVMKPVATGAVKTSGSGTVSQDAIFLMKAIDCKDPIALVNPISLEPPLSPNVASEITNRPIDLELAWKAWDELTDKHAFMIVEGIGGIRVPIKDDFSVLDMIERLEVPIVIVSRLSLGTINHTLLTIDAAASRGIEIAGVVFNGLERGGAGVAEWTNPDVIERLGGVRILGSFPHLDKVSVDRGEIGDIMDFIEENMDIDAIMNLYNRRREGWQAKIKT